MHNKHLVRLWMALIFIALSSGAYLLLPDKAAAPKIILSAPVVQNLPWENVATNTAIAETATKATQRQTEPKNSPTTTNPESKESLKTADQNPVAVSIEINDQKYPLSVPEKSTAYDAMNKLVADKKITAVFNKFSGLGYFVDEIDGIKTDKSQGKYWIYYLNGKPAQLGISQYILKKNDSITWKYEVPQF